MSSENIDFRSRNTKSSGPPFQMDLDDLDGVDGATIKLHQEILDIQTKQETTCDLKIHKETITVNKTISVPVTYEELVIEKKPLSTSQQNNSNEQYEMTRIPLRTESIEVIKHPIQLESVNIYKREVQEYKHVEETLKREELRIDKIGGSPTIQKKQVPT